MLLDFAGGTTHQAVDDIGSETFRLRASQQDSITRHVGSCVMRETFVGKRKIPIQGGVRLLMEGNVLCLLLLTIINVVHFYYYLQKKV